MLSSSFTLAIYAVLSAMFCLVTGQFNLAGFTDCDLICLGWAFFDGDGCVVVDTKCHCSHFNDWKPALDQCVASMCSAADYQAFQEIENDTCPPTQKRDTTHFDEMDMGWDTQTSASSSSPDPASTVLTSAIITPTRTLTLVDHPTNTILTTKKTFKPSMMAGASGFGADTKLMVLVGMEVGLVLVGAYLL